MMKRILFFTGLLLIFSTTFSQNWTLKETGVGLIAESENTNKPLKIVYRNTIWDVKELSEKGALEGKYNGNQLFAAWIQGPQTKEFLNSKGEPSWMLKYKIIYPDGKIFESEPKDFYPTGFSYFRIDIGANKEGVWKIEWYVYNRNTHQSSPVATTVFQTTWGKEEQKLKGKFKAIDNSQ